MADSELSDSAPPTSEEELIRIPNAQFISDVGAFLAGNPFPSLLKILYRIAQYYALPDTEKAVCKSAHLLNGGESGEVQVAQQTKQSKS